MPTTLHAVPRTVAEVLAGLGDVPEYRVWLTPTPGTAKEADAAEWNNAVDKRLVELVDGTLIEKASGRVASVQVAWLAGRMFGFALDHHLGVVLGPSGGYRLNPGLIRLPSCSFVAWDDLPSEEFSEDTFSDVPPRLVVEFVRPDNTPAEMTRKIAEYFAAGVKLVWVIDPKKKAATVYTSPTKFKELDETGVLEGGRVLPGFRLPLADVFAAGKRKRKKK